MSTIIKVEGLGKSYTISHEERERYTALRDVIARKAKSIFTADGLRNRRTGKKSREEFWALKDINFEVQQGDRIGIIGRNGAGKSTLLKILSRITEPTTGIVKIKGRVASLLEVGTGFHPELTGRENIFLNGAILGMSRAEVRKKFDEIVDFAEVEKFLDTPVKRYSSGMYVRLAFAVAAHLEPEILLIDEVLAVGDAEFQKKCLGKMEDVSKNEGRTILFVSHVMSSIKNLCNKGILLVDGNSRSIGDIETVVEKYLGLNRDNQSIVKVKLIENEYVKILDTFIKNERGDNSITFNNTDEISVGFLYEVKSVIRNFRMVVSLSNEYEIDLFYTSDCKIGESRIREKGSYSTVFTIPNHLLNKGKYFVKMRIDSPGEKVILATKNYLEFTVEQLFKHQLGTIFGDEPYGVIHPEIKWITKKVE